MRRILAIGSISLLTACSQPRSHPEAPERAQPPVSLASFDEELSLALGASAPTRELKLKYDWKDQSCLLPDGATSVHGEIPDEDVREIARLVHTLWSQEAIASIRGVRGRAEVRTGRGCGALRGSGLSIYFVHSEEFEPNWYLIAVDRWRS